MKKKLIISLLLVIALSFAIFAACQTTECTVTFDGEGVTTAPQKVEKGKTAIEPRDPEREGYTFEYWYLDDSNVPFNFDTAIERDITLTALWKKVEQKPSIDPSKVSGQGTKADPYLIQCATHLNIVASEVRDNVESYVNGHYRLDADIDLEGYQYTPIGTYEQPFGGVFDGNGKTISNLTLKPVIRSDGNKFYGLFGVTEQAVISNLNLADINVDVQSFKDGDGTAVYIGGVVGYASLTSFDKISVSGAINTFLMADNGANIGGIAGWYANSTEDHAYIVYTENCLVNIQMGIDESDGESGSLENARVGGLFGVVYNRNCTTAIVNCATYGKVYGGQYTGGITGYINGLTSVIDCYNAAAVTATSVTVSYAGGIVGSALNDNIIMGCVSIGDVTALKSTPNTYNYESYAGGIAGYAESDDYTDYFTAGCSVIDCYYAANATGADNITNHGTKYALSYLSALDKVIQRAGWTSACWTTDNGVIKPTDKTSAEAATDGKYTLTLQNGATSQAVDKSVTGTTGYALVGELDNLAASNGKVFWAWEIADGVQYKYYLPVVRNITLTAKWQDVTGIAKCYKGTGTLHETYDAGSIVLYSDGTLQWINDSAIGGTYRFDGTHLLFTVNSNTGDVSGIINGDKLTFEVDAGMTGTVSYEFTVYQPKIIGEYISDSGNLLTFAGDNRVSYEGAEVNSGDYVSGTYQAAGNTLTPTFKQLTGIVANSIVIQDDNAVVFHFTQGGESKTETFRKLGVIDYSDKPFVGEYNLVWVSSSSFTENRQLRFEADGTAVLASTFSEAIGRYYYIQSTGVLKTIIEGAVSNFKFDATEGVVYGILSRGGTTVRPVAMSKTARGAMEAYSNFGSEYKADGGDTVYLFQVADGKCYSFVNGQYGVVNVGQTLADGSEVQLGQSSYRIYASDLRLIGAEHGQYAYDNIQIALDGVNVATITGSNAGKYYYVAHADNMVTIVLDDKVIAFDYVQAQADNNVAAVPSHDGVQGVWFNAREDNPYYQKLVFDGFGHVVIFYMPKDSNEYRLNWGGSGWGSYQVTNYGALVYFNSSNKNIRFIFYADGQFAYTPDTFGGSSNYKFISKGYTGSTTPPVFPADKAGSYVNGEGASQLVLNLRADLTGTYRGNPLYDIVYDGQNKVYFTCNGVNYTFVLGQNGGKLLDGNDETTFTLAGAITEVIPQALCGLWTGKFEGYGVGANEQRGFEMQSDGTVYYYTNVTSGDKTQVSNVEYDYATYTVTFVDAGGFVWTLVYNVETEEISATGKNSENTTLTAALTKQN